MDEESPNKSSISPLPMDHHSEWRCLQSANAALINDYFKSYQHTNACISLFIAFIYQMSVVIVNEISHFLHSTTSITSSNCHVFGLQSDLPHLNAHHSFSSPLLLLLSLIVSVGECHIPPITIPAIETIRASVTSGQASSDYDNIVNCTYLWLNLIHLEYSRYNNHVFSGDWYRYSTSCVQSNGHLQLDGELEEYHTEEWGSIYNDQFDNQNSNGGIVARRPGLFVQILSKCLHYQ